MLARISRWTLPALILLVGLATYRFLFTAPGSEDVLPPRSEPWRIEPLHDEPRIVTDQQLAEVLDRVRPPGAPANTNLYVHALRLWGDQADFSDSDRPSGGQLRDYFLRDEVFRKWAGSAAPPLFAAREIGLAARSFDDEAAFQTSGSYHQDDLLATLAETGVPLDTPLETRDGAGTVADLLRQSLRDFHPDRLEFEWTVISYARYAFPLSEWRNKYGQRVDVESLVDLLLAAPLTQGPCNGLHRMEAIVVLYRVDQEAGGVLKPRTRQRLLDQMLRVSQLLAASQSEQGYWTRRWPLGAAALTQSAASATSDIAGDTAIDAADHQSQPARREVDAAELGDRLLVTGHQLEWLALAPEEVLPPRENLVRAGQWLVRTLLEIDEHDLRDRYGPYSHAVRALSLWRGRQPYDAWSAVHAEE